MRNTDLTSLPAPAKAMLDHGYDYGSAYALVAAGVASHDWYLLAAGVVVFAIKLASDLTDKKTA